MTLFAVACAAIYPLFHTGRPWRAAYWLFPIPNTDLQPVAELPQPADVGRLRRIHVRHVSALFWFIGLIPDLATLRDRAERPAPADSSAS